MLPVDLVAVHRHSMNALITTCIVEGSLPIMKNAIISKNMNKGSEYKLIWYTSVWLKQKRHAAPKLI
jgi:hypothetical protein